MPSDQKWINKAVAGGSFVKLGKLINFKPADVDFRVSA
jgi:hypothetical protein